MSFFKNHTFFIARRLSVSAEGEKSSPAIKVAITAVALSIIVMIATIAIVLGFKREIRAKVTGFNSHLTLYTQPMTESDNYIVTLTPTLKRIIEEQPYVTSFSLDVSIPAILKTSDNFKGMYLRNIGSRQITEFLTKNIVEGKIPSGGDGNDKLKIALPQKAANQLNLKLGDKIDAYFLSGNIRVRRLEIAAIYNTHFDSYDDVLLYGSRDLIQGLADVRSNQGTSISITVDDFSKIRPYSLHMQQTLNKALETGLIYSYYKIENAQTQGAGYFAWLAMLDTNVVVILTLMIFVACITLISGMLIIILDKKRFIGLVRSLGMSIKEVRHIFIFLALRIAVWGILIGNIIAIPLLLLQDKYHIIPLKADSYYIDFVPVELNWVALLILNAAAVIVIYLTLIIPSWFAAKISPAETIRFE